jgi:DNA mismatch repair protein MutL
MELPESKDVVGRIGDLWGEEIARQLLAVTGEVGELRLRGLVQRPDATNPGFRRAQLFVGGRPFRERSLVHAVERGYRTTIPEGNRPWLFLFLEAPSGSVDVNVHPTKAEVRFQQLGAVEALVERAVRSALETEESAATFDRSPARPVLEVREAGPKGEVPLGVARPSESQMALFLAAGEASTWSAVGMPVGEDREAEGVSAAEMAADEEQPRLWQVHRSWILAEVRDGILLIDQHSAHERILFERIMRRLDQGGDDGQRLLFPLTLRLTPPEYALVEDLGGILRTAGFEVEGFGGHTVIVHAVPAPHARFDAERCFREMIEELTLGSPLTRSARNQHERVAMSFACKAAIKAGQALDPREIQELFDQLFATELPYHDVHGRPTVVRLSRAELERKLGR